MAERAQALGFDAVRVTTPDATGPEMRAHLETWLAQDYHGSMDWMADTAERRADPRALWPDVKSIVMLGLNYGPEQDPLTALARRDHGAISVYARARDYHDVIKGKLKELAGFLVAHRNWLAGDRLTYADLAAASHLSCADYLGDVPWDEDEAAKDWYARVKSRPAFRTILADRIPGMAPAETYADLDF